MVKFYNVKKLRAVGILVMMALSPLTVSFAYAENREINKVDFLEDEQKVQNVKSVDTESKIILTERIINGKLELIQIKFEVDFINNELSKRLSSEIGSGKWGYVTGKSYQSGIVLYDGKVFNIQEKFDGIYSKNSSDFTERHLEIESEESNDLHKLYENTNDLAFQVIFSGKNPQTEDKSVYVDALQNSSIWNIEIEQNSSFFHMMLNLSIVNGDKLESNSEFFREYILLV